MLKNNFVNKNNYNISDVNKCNQDDDGNDGYKDLISLTVQEVIVLFQTLNISDCERTIITNNITGNNIHYNNTPKP